MTAGRRRVLFVGGTDFDLPLSSGIAKKWDAVSEVMDVLVVGRARGDRAADPRFRAVPHAPPPFGGLSHYAFLPAIVARELRRFAPEVIVTQSPYEAFALLPVCRAARPRPKLLVELHGDWRTAARLYGSGLRRAYARASDRAAVVALRQADGTRAVSEFTASLATQATGRRPLAVFPTYFDLESFTSAPPRPLPDRPAVGWVGVLQRYKNPRALADAWRLAAPKVDRAQLVMVGVGPLQNVIDELVREFPDTVRSVPRLTPSGVAQLLDDSTVLALSSESEGLPRVIMEAFTRGRAVVSTAVGGIPDIVKSGENGLLVEPGDPRQLARALVQVLNDRELAERLGRRALADAGRLRGTPSGYAEALRDVVERVLQV
jgi:glycosyltransferase involved in cell wall biosynthesis